MSLFNNKARRLRNRIEKWKFKLGVELFEERLLLSQIPVTNTNDNGVNSLRAAIVAANAAPGSTIVFQIPGTSPFVINVSSGALPSLTAQTTIDGTTESTFLGSAAVIEINGGGNPFDGLTLGTTSGGSSILGLDIANFNGAGIRVESAGDTVTDNLIGTDPTGKSTGPGNQVGIFIDGTNGGSAATIGGAAAGGAIPSGSTPWQACRSAVPAPPGT